MTHPQARPARRSDIPAFAELFAGMQMRTAGKIVMPPEEFFTFWWTDEAFSASDSSWVIVSDEGSIDGVTMVQLPEARAEPANALVVTRAGREPVQGELLASSEERARVDGRSRVQTGAPRADASQTALIEARGYRVVRSAFMMEIDLGGPLPAAAPPDGIAIRAARPDDARELYELHQGAFRHEWGFIPESFEAWRRRLEPPNDLDLVLLAVVDDAIASMCSAVVDGDLAFIAEVATSEEHRGRGLASTLLRRAFSEVAGRGCTRATLAVDTVNPTGAVGVYERAGMHQLMVLDMYELDLSPPAGTTAVGTGGAGRSS